MVRAPRAALAAALLLAASTPARAGLFIAQDVWMAMAFWTPEYRMAEAMYGVTPRLSVGAGMLSLRSDERVPMRQQVDVGYLQANWLVHRIHRPDSVANAYVFGGLGASRGDFFAGTASTLHGGLQLDWESRRWYVNGNVHWWRADAFSYRIDSLTVGWAPYAADYEDWATWFLLRGERRENLTEGTEVFPTLRLFRRDWWFEIGRSTRGAWMFNVMHVF
ncbi:MAG: hypothetical protein ACK54X_03075 [Burkholderiales bacterium]|jgi:hypothetical protein